MCFQHAHNTNCFLKAVGGKEKKKLSTYYKVTDILLRQKSILTLVLIPSALVTRVSSQVHSESGFIYILRNICSWEHLAVIQPKVETQSE